MAVNEFSFSVDDFQNPKVTKDAEAIMTVLTRLLLLEPGTIQSHPDMGVGLYSKYAFGVEGVETELQSDFQRQIEKYLPQFQGVRIGVARKEKALFISAEIDKVLYGIYYDIENKNVTSKYSRLSEL